LNQANFKEFKIFGKNYKLGLEKRVPNFISKTKQLIPGQRGQTTHQAVTESPLPDALI